ncbi:hypothetical protein [Kallotenue papyrolyticum]|uniref:hypothetical protein n=1 Tax=Kallotenue papyrolyticum TaxID=1325125 RepID=UPI0004785E89|nr:hypothetical protein [Kallotenue papyrolyticum]
MIRRYLALLAVVALLVPASAAARSCFPETGHCIDGRIEQYWQQNGGLSVFGFPIAPQAPEVNRDTGQTYETQWMERNRFELHPENAAPYDVLLGRLGDDRLRQLGIDWQTLPKANPSDPHYFPQTGQAISFEPFWQYWRSHGLELGDRGISERESLALFGYPISPARMETNSSGDTVLTQWFERARFEWHPNNPEPYKVLLGLLGNEVRGGGTPAPGPGPSPSPSPSPNPPAPPVTGSCATNAPAPSEGAAAWVTNPTPPQNSDQTVCARLITGGQPRAGVRVTIDVQYKSTTSTYSGVTNDQGVASITFGIGRATVGYTVDVVVRFDTGQTARTSFTPQ